MLVNLRKLLDPRRRTKPPPVASPEKPVPAASPVPAPDPFDAARDRLRAEIPPPADDD